MRAITIVLLLVTAVQLTGAQELWGQKLSMVYDVLAKDAAVINMGVRTKQGELQIKAEHAGYNAHVLYQFNADRMYQRIYIFNDGEAGLNKMRKTMAKDYVFFSIDDNGVEAHKHKTNPGLMLFILPPNGLSVVHYDYFPETD